MPLAVVPSDNGTIGRKERYWNLRATSIGKLKYMSTFRKGGNDYCRQNLPYYRTSLEVHHN